MEPEPESMIVLREEEREASTAVMIPVWEVMWVRFAV